MIQLVQNHWNDINKPELGFMNTFNEDVRNLDKTNPDAFPNLRRGSVILVGSDYSGQHDLAQYETFSFLLADFERCSDWESRRADLRRKYLPDGRRVSYKNLNDRKRRRALIPFLNAANLIPGLIVTILVNKRIQSLFKEHGRLSMETPDLIEYNHWNSAIFEKMRELFISSVSS